MKSTKTQKVNIYCDESRVENQNSEHMVIGAIVVPRNHKESIVKKIKSLKAKHNFFQEIKWNKTGETFGVFYKDLVELFRDHEHVSFRAVIVDKTKVAYDMYHDNDEELAFFKFYYLLLRELLEDQSEYYVFLDKKPTRDKNRARALKAYLDSHLLYQRDRSQIKHLQAYDSQDNVLIQLADFFTGMLAYANNELHDSSYKSKLVEFSQKTLGVDFIITTNRRVNKFNLLNWKPRK